MLKNNIVAIDPLALLLPPSVYAKIIEMVHPHVPKVVDIEKALAAVTVEQRKEILVSAKQMVETANIVIEAATKTTKQAVA